MPKIIVIGHLLLVIVENVVTFFGTQCRCRKTTWYAQTCADVEICDNIIWTNL